MENMKVLRKNAALQCLSDVSQGEMAVLCYLHFSHNGATAGELTNEFQVRSSRTAAILNALEKKGYAYRKPDPSDKRKVRVYITEEGKRFALHEHEDAIRHFEEILQMIGKEDSRHLIRIVQRITDCMEDQFFQDQKKGNGKYGN